VAVSSHPGPDQIYHGHLAEGRFMIQRCSGCARHVFYPRTVYPHCGSNDLTWIAASGRGVVYSTSVVRRLPEKGGDHNVAIVDLAEGARMISRVDGIAPEDVRIGMEVRARIEQAEPRPFEVFTLTGDGDAS